MGTPSVVENLTPVTEEGLSRSAIRAVTQSWVSDSRHDRGACAVYFGSERLTPRAYSFFLAVHIFDLWRAVF